MANLPNSCLPLSDPTNKLASLKAKAIKAQVAKPFPKADVIDFLPPWAVEVRALHVRQDEL